LQLVFDSNITLNCQFNFYLEYTVKQQWAHNLHTQNTYNVTGSDNTMPSRKRKSPRKNSGMQPDYYGTDGDQDILEITGGKEAGAKPPSNKRHRIGYKEVLTKKNGTGEEEFK
jgi:hypothetical protein